MKNDLKLLADIKIAHGRLCAIAAWLKALDKPKASTAVHETNALLYNIIKHLDSDCEGSKLVKY